VTRAYTANNVRDSHAAESVAPATSSNALLVIDHFLGGGPILVLFPDHDEVSGPSVGTGRLRTESIQGAAPAMGDRQGEAVSVGELVVLCRHVAILTRAAHRDDTAMNGHRFLGDRRRSIVSRFTHYRTGFASYRH